MCKRKVIMLMMKFSKTWRQFCVMCYTKFFYYYYNDNEVIMYKCTSRLWSNYWSFSHSIQWPYQEFYGIQPNTKAQLNNEFIISIKKGGKKAETMRFSTEHRADVLTEALVSTSMAVCQWQKCMEQRALWPLDLS